MKTAPNDSAFPLQFEQQEIDGSKQLFCYSGMTKREEFTKAAMQGLCANPHADDHDINEIAAQAVELADATIAALNKEQT